MFPTAEILKDYKLYWQYPVITEQTFYNQNKHNPIFLGFPWATVVDKYISHQVIYNILIKYLDKSINYYTCCQTIHFRKLIPLLKALNIQTVYISHKKIGEDSIDGIKLLPCPLYAVNVEDTSKNSIFNAVDPLEMSRNYLYSFQGAYDPSCYLTTIRKRIFEMKHPDNCYILDTGDWHFHEVVYSKNQNFKKEVTLSTKHTDNTSTYNEILLASRYSLCPSGSGPNSIRLWESLAIGTIPILLADTLELPPHELWDKAIVKVRESDLTSIPDILSRINEIEERTRRQNCMKIYNDLKDNFKNSKDIVHYCCGSYHRGNFGGVARFDYQLSKVFPHRVFFEGPRQKMEMLAFLENTDNVTVITDNHLACDIPNEYETVLVHHGVAQTHADREPEWDEYWKKLCCEGQKKMLYHRDPKTTKILSISQFCTDEFTKYYGDDYTKFERRMILHTSELDHNVYKRQWNKVPVILGNWPCVNKGKRIVDQLSMGNNRYTFKQLSVRSNGPREVDITDFNRRKQQIYIDSDLFLSISLCEGNSYAALDALLCGIPVVSSDVGLFYRDIPDDCFVKLDWTRMDDIEYVKEKVDYALEHKEIIGRKGREWYLANCRFDKWSTNMMAFI